MIAYYDAEAKLAIAHRYLRPDGRLGASGRPDPKWVFKDGIIYAVLEPGARTEQDPLR